MKIDFKQHQLFLFHSYFTAYLLNELSRNDFLKSDFFEGMNFGMPWIKDELRKNGVNNQGCAMMVLYAMLVIPHETIQKAYSDDYNNINLFLEKCAIDTRTSYRSDKKSVNFIKHFRNAVSHVLVEFRPDGSIRFKDMNPRTKESFSTILTRQNLSQFINQLQKVHFKYIEDLKQQISQSGG